MAYFSEKFLDRSMSGKIFTTIVAFLLTIASTGANAGLITILDDDLKLFVSETFVSINEPSISDSFRGRAWTEDKAQVSVYQDPVFVGDPISGDYSEEGGVTAYKEHHGNYLGFGTLFYNGCIRGCIEEGKLLGVVDIKHKTTFNVSEGDVVLSLLFVNAGNIGLVKIFDLTMDSVLAEITGISGGIFDSQLVLENNHEYKMVTQLAFESTGDPNPNPEVNLRFENSTVVVPANVPEPGTLILLGTGLLGFSFRQRFSKLSNLLSAPSAC